MHILSRSSLEGEILMAIIFAQGWASKEKPQEKTTRRPPSETSLVV
jgi:hypothetical protein